jgi:hypothetical protein
MTDSHRGFCMSLRLASSVLGIAAGLIVFFIFTFHYGNVEAGVWALISAVFSAMAFHLFLLYRNHRLETWHTPQSLSALRNLAILGICASISATIYYFYTALGSHESVYPYSDSHLLRGVWSMMTLKWTVALAFFSQKYKKLLDREYSLM